MNQNWKRTHYLNELRKENNNENVILNGWVHKIRHHGSIIFINLRDSYGITQIVINEETNKDLFELTSKIKLEYCLAVKGIVHKRPANMINKDMPTGEIDIEANEIKILSKSIPLPFNIEQDSNASEHTRLEYRYLDLRSFGMQERLKLRSNISYYLRDYLHTNHFIEVETPTLIKSTPEGARDFLVPSRIHKGSFYALAQSPQIYKQLSMVGGLDKYYQIARCYRDEDARGDRQPEFTQLDIEKSFVNEEDIYQLGEELMKYTVFHTLSKNLQIPFPRLTYFQAMDQYGTDKPDLRFELQLEDFTDLAKETDFKVFHDALDNNGIVKTLILKDKAEQYSRKKIEELEKIAKIYHAKGLAWVKVQNDTFEGGIARFINPLFTQIKEKYQLNNNDILFFTADKWEIAVKSLGAVRLELANTLNLINHDELNFLWITDFPLFEWNEEENRYNAMHHMFTMPKESDIEKLDTDPATVIGQLYDLVCNGFELASGSMRIYEPLLQEKVFNLVGFNKELAQERFGFLLDSFQYGAPPHGGIAFGLDRLAMIFSKQSSIKEVITFPKNTVASSPMDKSPAPVDENQLKDLGLNIKI